MPLDPNTPVLVVDDQYAIVEVVCVMVRKLGFEVVDRAYDGATALSLMREKRYGLVISDLNMDGMNGLQLLKAIRSDEKLNHVYFILTTASLDSENVIAAKRLGADSFILKPFSPKVLREKLEALS